MNPGIGRTCGRGLVLCVLLGGACANPGARARRVQEIESLRRDNARLERLVAQHDGTITSLRRQVGNLKGFAPDRPSDLFAADKIVLGSLSGGADYDGQAGDDGVTIHLRVMDAEGDVVKAPGRITVQLLDNTHLLQPRVLGVYVFDDPETLRGCWHGKFGTRHYTLKCPFRDGTTPPSSGRVGVKVEFLDYLTGRTLTVVDELIISTPPS